MKTILKWIFLSSADASKVSTTIKGLAGFIPSVLVFFALLHVNVQADQLTNLVDGLALMVSTISAAVSAVFAVIGAIEKIISTIKGTNAVLIQSREG